MLIEEIYNRKPHTIPPDVSIKDAVKTFIKEKCNGLIVVNKGIVLGVLAMQDIAAATVPIEFKENINLASAMFRQGMFREVCADLAKKKVKDIMRTDFLSATLETNIMAVMSDFLKNDLYIVPVVDKNRLIGVITRREIRKAVASRMGL